MGLKPVQISIFARMCEVHDTLTGVDEPVLAILRVYAERCIPIPRTTERFYWSVSCLPGSPDKTTAGKLKFSLPPTSAFKAS